MRHLTFAVLALCLSVLAVNANVNAGLDSYEVYLNDKLMLKQSVNQPLNLRTLALEKATAADKLVVYYRHCHEGEGKGRRLIIEDAKGNVLKKWEFPDAKGERSAMTIAVKDLLELEKKGNGLRMYYASNEMPKPELLASLQMNGKSTALR
jgi:hypothetical protein